ncbi:MAG: hypothetical protein J6K17_12210 [Oscillospiraceae bacterium]|nr:hypothetical protein [Oscillospiraceae bacterium]
MARFRFMMDIEPETIPNLDDKHKRDCVDVLNSIINSAFKYTMIFSLGCLAFFAIYSIFSVTYCMRMGKMLPQLPFVIPFIAVAIFLLNFVAGTMNKQALIVEVLLCTAMLFTVMISMPCVWIMPFAFYGVIANLKLLTLIPLHKAISEQPGYPDFTPLPTKEEVAESMQK